MSRTMSRIIPMALWTAACGGSYTVAQNGADGGAGSPRTDAAGLIDATNADAGGASDAMDAAADGPPVVANDAAANVLSGTYKGYIESFQFPDGSDVIDMNLTFPGNGTVTGSVYFGSGTPLSPPTDPNVGYPPGITTAAPVSLFEGFAFTVVGGTYSPPRVQLSIYSKELWKQWCELQTTTYPVYSTESDGGCGALIGYACVPNGGFSGSAAGCIVGGPQCVDASPISVDCGKYGLCFRLDAVCTCTSASCTVSPMNPGDVAFDMQLTPGSLNGSVTGLDTQLHNVHLTLGP
ncbi:MAG: hypothetical protein ACRENE_31950 [Polyangiaceae bacterium]